MSIIRAGENYEITPNDVKLDTNQVNPLIGSRFGEHESEMAAADIVWFCQQRKKGWDPFTVFELHKPSCKEGDKCPAPDYFDFGSLISDDFIVRNGATCSVTQQFVDICYKTTLPK